MRSLLIVSLFAMAGCGEAETSNLAVEVCGDLQVPDDLDMLRFSVVDGEQGELWSAVSPLDSDDAGLPYRGFVPDLGAGQWVKVQGLKAGVVRIGVSGRQGDPTAVALNASCLGVQCPLGQTCKDGDCALIDGVSQCL